jgi:membrane protease YdiL (CAAX protease family)
MGGDWGAALLFIAGALSSLPAARQRVPAGMTPAKAALLRYAVSAASAIGITFATGSFRHGLDVSPRAVIVCAVVGMGSALLSASATLCVTMGPSAARRVLFASASSSALLACLCKRGQARKWLLTAVLEEMLWRGGLQSTLPAGPTPLLFTAALFSSWHWRKGQGGQIWPILDLFAFGIGLGVAMSLTGALLCPIAMHLARNAILDVTSSALALAAAARPGRNRYPGYPSYR